jgi:hypothetical protein
MLMGIYAVGMVQHALINHVPQPNPLLIQMHFVELIYQLVQLQIQDLDVLIFQLSVLILVQQPNVFQINQEPYAIGLEQHVKLEHVIMHQIVLQLLMIVIPI